MNNRPSDADLLCGHDDPAADQPECPDCAELRANIVDVLDTVHKIASMETTENNISGALFSVCELIDDALDG